MVPGPRPSTPDETIWPAAQSGVLVKPLSTPCLSVSDMKRLIR